MSMPLAPALRERRLGLALAVLSAAAVAVGVTPELLIDCPDLNDSAYHLALALRADEALQRGQSPVDFWYPDVGMGFPLFRHYQHLPHLFLVAIHRLTGGLVSIANLYRVVLGALLAVFPLVLFASLRRFGLTPLTAGCAALVAPLVSTPHLYGLGLESYLWGGSGLYAQLFASVLVPLALAESYRAVRSGRGLARAAVLLTASFLSQLVYGYMAALSTLAFVIPPRQRLRKALRLAVLLALAFVVGSYFFVPALRDADFANHSVWEKLEKWNSLGPPAVLGHLVAGRLFDQGRWPVLTILVAVGLVYALWRGNEPLRLIAGLFLAWLLLYFGRPMWGQLIDLLPLASDIPLHRLIGAVHLFGLALAGCGLALLVRIVAGAAANRWRIIAAGVLVAAVVAWPAYERYTYLQNSRRWKSRSAAAVAADTDLKPLLAQLHALDGGRVYVGLPGRSTEYLRVGRIPLSAFCLVEGIDTLGFLWIPITYASDIQVWFDPDNEVHCRTFGVRYLVFAADRRPPAFARLIHEVGKYSIYEVDGASYFAVGDVPFAVPCSKRTVYTVGRTWLQSWLPRWHDYPALAVAGRTPGDWPLKALDPNSPVRALNSLARPFPLELTALRPHSPWACEVDLRRPAAIVRLGGYHPSVRATVDGAPASVFPVTPGFAAVQVPAGQHEIEFRYHPGARWPWFVIGAVALLCASIDWRRAAPWAASAWSRRGRR
jgi:hypothetical protein